jgi:hypothetical protein
VVLISEYSLQAIEIFKQSINQMTKIVKTTEGISSKMAHPKASENLTETMQQGFLTLQGAQKSSDDDPNIRFWFPIFFGLVCVLCQFDDMSRY